ncbi:MAG: hypothetical protein C0520_03110 [Sphingopyxis sp.]|nr:hypothetical protein [Sphingopyxis sp.]
MTGANANDTRDPGETDRIIAQELDQLLESPLFVRSPVLSRLLQFLVEHRLRGGRSAPKAYAIATEALGRSADFDPAVDSYPRVMVGRLRSLLDRYYADTAWVHRLRVPQGSYEVVVQHRVPPPGRSIEERSEAFPLKSGLEAAIPGRPATPDRVAATTSPERRVAGWLLAIAIFGLILFAAWRFLGAPLAGAPVPMPLLEISAPQSGDTPQSRAQARALDGKLRDGLRRFDLVDLRSARAPGSKEPVKDADYRLDVSLVRTFDGPVDVTLVLNRIADQRTIWSQQFRVAEADVPEFTTIEPALAQIGGDYGLIVRDQVQRETDNFAPGFPCFAQFNRMRQMRSGATARQIDACLRKTLEREPLNPVALSSLSLLRFGDWQPLRGTPAGMQAFAEARALAQRAYQNSAGSTAGLFAMARSNFYVGNCSGGNAMGDAARRLNPYDADIAGFLGLFKLSCGQAVEGEALLRRSLELDASYPGVPAVSLAFLLSQQGKQDEATAILDQMPSPSNMEPQYMMVRAIVLARQGNVEAGRRIWQRLLAYTKQPADAPPEAVLRRFMITPVVIDRSAAALRDSGVVPAKGEGRE